MSDPPAEATLRLTVAELDELLQEVRMDDTDVDDGLQASYLAGHVRGSEAMHRAVIERADIIIE